MLRAASLLILFVQAAKAEVPFDPPARIPVPGWGIPTWMRRGTKMSPKNWPTCVFWGNCIEKYGGLDQNSNPLWEATNATSEVVSAFKPVRRVIYDSDSDTMYLAGDVKEQNWGSFLRVKKFTDWSKGNRNAAFTAEYVVVFENAAWANIQMYRWCPSGACMSTATTPSSKTNDK